MVLGSVGEIAIASTGELGVNPLVPGVASAVHGDDAEPVLAVVRGPVGEAGLLGRRRLVARPRLGAALDVQLNLAQLRPLLVRQLERQPKLQLVRVQLRRRRRFLGAAGTNRREKKTVDNRQ